MQGDGYFDERVAARYDESAGEMFDRAVVDPVVDFLVELAGSGGALELGIGTGRIALPLAERGVLVHGIELSRAMAARLREKPGGSDIGVTIGDFSTTTVERAFSVAYVVFNTIGNLTTQTAQVACFRNVAAHLVPGGCFVVELEIPEVQRLPPGDTFRVFQAGPDALGNRRVRPRRAAAHLTSLRAGRRAVRAPLASVPLRVARRARPDGAARRDDLASALERLEPRAVHER